jgi:hypothetical protein
MGPPFSGCTAGSCDGSFMCGQKAQTIPVRNLPDPSRMMDPVSRSRITAASPATLPPSGQEEMVYPVSRPLPSPTEEVVPATGESELSDQ